MIMSDRAITPADQIVIASHEFMIANLQIVIASHEIMIANHHIIITSDRICTVSDPIDVTRDAIYVVADARLDSALRRSVNANCIVNPAQNRSA